MGENSLTSAGLEEENSRVTGGEVLKEKGMEWVPRKIPDFSGA